MTLARRTPKAGASACPDLPLAKPRPGHQRRRSVTQQGLMKLKKTEAKVRDFFRCQFPGCTMQGRHNVDGAHLDDAGMGGRPSVSSHRSDYVTLCNQNGPDGGHHRGKVSLHSTHVLVKPLSTAGADGPLAWYLRGRTGNEWGAYRHIGTSRSVPAVVRS